MPWILTCVLAGILCLNGFITTDAQRNGPADSGSRMTGSGGWSLSQSDDEDLLSLSSGSGSGIGDVDSREDSIPSYQSGSTTVTTPYRPTDRTPTDCEKMKLTSQSSRGRYVPRCLPTGDFDSLQCRGFPGTAECWCSDLRGREVPGTLMEAPNSPSCEDGINLPPCVHKLVKQTRSKLVGSFHPKCTVDGQFEPVQCQENACFCVDMDTGAQIAGTQVLVPGRPRCGDLSQSATEQTTKVEKRVKVLGQGKTDVDLNENSQQTTTTTQDDIKQEGEETREDNKTEADGKDVTQKNGRDGHQGDKMEKASDIMSQPGILAGIIGGSVVLLLCLVLLIMFVIYRMRKKDEGSYPLDEPRKTPNYNYVRAPEKEFYA